MEVTITAPKDDTIRRQLIFDPKFQDVDLSIEQVRPGTLDFREFPAFSQIVQESVLASAALQEICTQAMAGSL